MNICKLLARICEILCCGMGLNGMMQREMTIEIPICWRSQP